MIEIIHHVQRNYPDPISFPFSFLAAPDSPSVSPCASPKSPSTSLSHFSLPYSSVSPYETDPLKPLAHLGRRLSSEVGGEEVRRMAGIPLAGWGRAE